MGCSIPSSYRDRDGKDMAEQRLTTETSEEKKTNPQIFERSKKNFFDGINLRLARF